MLTKIIKGLYYHHFEKAIPANYIIKHFPKSGKEIKENHNELLSYIKWVIPNYNNVFRYGFTEIENKFDSIWITDYFKNARFMSFVRDPKTIENKSVKH